MHPRDRLNDYDNPHFEKLLFDLIEENELKGIYYDTLLKNYYHRKAEADKKRRHNNSNIYFDPNIRKPQNKEAPNFLSNPSNLYSSYYEQNHIPIKYKRTYESNFN